MRKSKRQLRAEAVERLRNCEYHTMSDYVLAMLGWEGRSHFEGSHDALIDLLTDDPYEHITAKTLATALRDRDKWEGRAEKYAEALEKLGCTVLANGTVYPPSENLDAQAHAEIEDAERSAKAPSDESEIARELGKALAERDRYREKLGEAVDAAQQIVKLMEVER